MSMIVHYCKYNVCNKVQERNCLERANTAPCSEHLVRKIHNFYTLRVNLQLIFACNLLIAGVFTQFLEGT